jgi:hypothetical protein
MSILDNGKTLSPMDMAKYSTPIKITTFRDTFRMAYLRIMVFFLPKTFSTKANSNTEWLGAKVNISKDPKQLRASLEKIIPLEIVSKRHRIILSLVIMKMAFGAGEN